jgi:hypothetical protein
MPDNSFFLPRMREYFEQRSTVDESVFEMKDILQGDPRAKEQLERVEAKKKQSQVSQHEKLFGKPKGK